MAPFSRVGKLDRRIPGHDGSTNGTALADTRMSFIAPLPVTGPWTSLGLSRAGFLAILLGSTVTFLVVPTPLWTHLREGHFIRLAVSYAVIPAGSALLLARAGRLAPGLLLRATLVLALLKLVLTTGLMMAIALGR